MKEVVDCEIDIGMKGDPGGRCGCLCMLSPDNI